MASGMELGLDISSTQELHFVDHVECKIVSPDKEVISPIKGQVKSIFPSSPVSDEIESPEKESDKSDQNISKNSDSGLDSSNNSSDYGNEHFVDRQEKYVNDGELEKIISPARKGPGLFPSSGNISSQSLDAINNNEEVENGNDAKSNVRVEKVKKDIYLGKEVCLHGSGNAKSQVDLQVDSVRERHVSETSMNLYWYSGSLNIDLEELEAFKDSQNEHAASNVQVNVSNEYYLSKTGADNKDGNVFKSEANFDVKQSPVKRECWSPAFESASSRILDLASELKSEPKNKKNKVNENLRDSADYENHPWGLASESRVITELVVEHSDELPEIGDFTGTDASENITKGKDVVLSQESITDQHDEPDATGMMEWKSRETRYEDVADAVGYMELKDKPPTTVKSTESKSENNTKKEQNANKKKQIGGEDVADAVGYIELKDKPPTTVKSTESKSENTTKKEQNANKKMQIGGEDVADAVGYMEMKDRNIEQMIVSADQKVLETSQVKMTTERKVFEQSQRVESSNIESQIIGGFSQTELDRNVGLDAPDAKMEVQNVHLQPVQSTAVEHKEKVVPKIKFEPFIMKRTYLIDEKSENILLDMGGRCNGTMTIIDEYLDDKNYALTLKDCWLRLRNKKFEMKVNSAFGYDPNRTLKAEMISSENEIIEVLMKLYEKKLEQKRRVSERQLDVLIDALNITEFVTFETTRKRFIYDIFVVTLDLTNFGFQVGEIEAVANSAKEMTDGLKKMDVLATKLGLRPLQSN